MTRNRPRQTWKRRSLKHDIVFTFIFQDSRTHPTVSIVVCARPKYLFFLKRKQMRPSPWSVIAHEFAAGLVRFISMLSSIISSSSENQFTKQTRSLIWLSLPTFATHQFIHSAIKAWLHSLQNLLTTLVIKKGHQNKQKRTKISPRICKQTC